MTHHTNTESVAPSSRAAAATAAPMMRTPWLAWPLVLLLASVFMGGLSCVALLGKKTGASGGKQGQLAAGRDPDGLDEIDPDSDDETGIRGISKLVRKFNRALSKKAFDRASQLLQRAEKRADAANSVTRSHPDFEDQVATLERARTRLETAIEDDRIARRNAAIDDLIRRGEQAMQQGQFVVREFQQRVPTREDIAHLDEALATMTALDKEGTQYASDARYAAHGEGLEQAILQTGAQLRAARWQRASSDAIGPAVVRGYEAHEKAKSEKRAARQAAHLRTVAKAFGACSQALAKQKDREGYDPKLTVGSRLGVLTAAATAKRCQRLADQAAQKADAIDWRGSVETVIGTLSKALDKARNDIDPAGALAANREAVDAVVVCQSELNALRRAPGADPKIAFPTTLGKHTISHLIRACAKEQARLTKERPRLDWRRRVGDFLETVAQAVAVTARIPKKVAAAERITLWEKGALGLQQCDENATPLLRDPAADTRAQLQTPFGAMTLPRLQETCRKNREQALKRQREAQEQAKIEAFVQSCKGDEASVAKRNGIPARIETFPQGRVFYYDRPLKGEANNARAGFDTTGARTDFWSKWKKDISAYITELRRSITATRKQGPGKEMLAAVQRALPVVQACEATISKINKSPGYDATMTFKTPLGSLTPAQLATACGPEGERLASRRDPLGWVIELETVGDRAAEAMKQIKRAKKERNLADAASLWGRAKGGWTECAEQADALSSDGRADHTRKIETPFGSKMTVAELAKACLEAQEKADVEIDKNLAAQKLEAFIATCKADEKAVARREGIPPNIEPVGAGRVFVYERSTRAKGTKGKTKRYAFDAEGRRVDEKILRATGSTAGQ